VLTMNGLFFWRSHPLTATWFIIASILVREIGFAPTQA